MDKNKKDYLWKDYGKYFLHIFKSVTETYSSKQTMQMYIGFNFLEKKILDSLIIKCFPEIYMQYLESITPN